MQIDSDIKQYEEEIISHRRYLHQIPEIGFEEFKTASYIEEKLKQLDLTVQRGIAKTGVIGYLHTNDTAKTIAFRSDMDALLLDEETDREFASKHEGRMHGCGHDGHMSTLLIWAKYLCANKERLNVNVLFVFQPAEEGPGGAEPMIQTGLFKKYNVSEIYGIHVYPEALEGRLAVRAGAMMAKPGEFDITIYGKGGHGAQPHNSIDAIVIAGHLITSFQHIISRNVNPVKSAVITVGRIEGGSRRNIIADSVRMEGTIRAFEDEVFDLVSEQMKKQCKAAEIAYNCTIDFEMRPMYPALVNDEDLTNKFIKANKEYVDIIQPQMIAEDFAYYQKVMPGLFFFVGTRNEQKNYVFPLHSGKFDMDERVLLNGIQAYKNMMVNSGYYSAKVGI